MVQKMKKKYKIIILIVVLILLFIISLFVGSSNITIKESFLALFGKGQNNHIVIMQKIRLPRAIAATFVGAGLAISGLIMQTTLGNEMASPSTLGVANAATLGANIAIIGFAGGFLATGNNLNNYFANVNPYSTSIVAFVFAFLSVLLILGLGRIRKLPKETIILFGIALGSVWTALTSLLQFYATDVSLSAAVVWSFGDLSRATYKIDIIIIAIVIVSVVFFNIFASRYNALLSGDDVARSVGVDVSKLRFISLLLASLIVAVCVSNLGIIGFVGIICPHIAKRIFGYNHKISITATSLVGAILLLFSDTLARLIGKGTAIPVGIVTSIIGAPFFLYLIFRKRRTTNENGN